jgi:DTW domain-containing protein YfiP
VPDVDAPRPARLRCRRCDRPQAACLCGWMVPTANRLPVLVLQHRLESGHAKGSLPLLRLSLAHCRCETGEAFEHATLAGWLTAPHEGVPVQPLLLYPAGGAAPGPTPPGIGDGPLPDPGRWRLVLLDGTWRQTRQLLHANPLLQALPRWPLPAPAPSRYLIRRAHQPMQRSTLEAACAALGALEGRPDRYAPLLAAFDGWVRSVAAFGPA